MNRTEIERVLANWIAQAISGDGKLADGIDPAKWIAANFVSWWHPVAESSLSDADLAAHRIRDELTRLGGWKNNDLHGTLEELTHLTDALADLRSTLGLHSVTDNADA